MTDDHERIQLDDKQGQHRQAFGQKKEWKLFWELIDVTYSQYRSFPDKTRRRFVEEVIFPKLCRVAEIQSGRVELEISDEFSMGRLTYTGRNIIIDKTLLFNFEVIAETGNIPEKDMFGTYNMGIGMMFAVDKKDVDKAMEILKANGEDAYVIGNVVKSDDGVIFS